MRTRPDPQVGNGLCGRRCLVFDSIRLPLFAVLSLAALLFGPLAVMLNGSESLSITRRARWPGYEMGFVRGLHATGSTVWLGIECYFASIGSLIALDVSDPASPAVLSSTPTAGGASWCAWAFDNGFAYAVGSSPTASVLEVYDLSDPCRPVRRGHTSIIQTSGSPPSMMAHQGYLWVFTEKGIETYDVRNPSAPRHSGSLAWADSQGPSQVHVCGDFGVLMTRPYGVGQQDVLRVIDLRNPARPVETDSMPLEASGYENHLVVTTVDDYVYYVTQSQSKAPFVHAARVTSLGAIEPTAVSLAVRASSISRMWPVGDFLYMAGITYNYGQSPSETYGLHVVDVTDRLQPRALASPGVVPVGICFYSAACDGHVFMSLMGPDGDALHLLDAANPGQPVDLGTVWRTWFRAPGAYGLVGGTDEPIWRVRDGGTSRIRLFGTAGLLQGDATAYRDWNLPFVPRGTSTNPNVEHMLLYGNYCYVLCVGTVYYPEETARLYVYDLSGAGPPVYKGNTQLIAREEFWNMGYHTVKIDGDELYLSYHPGRLDIYSLSTPTSPQFLSRTAVCDPRDLEIHNGYAYLFGSAQSGGSNRWLEVVDVRDPGHPSAATRVFEYPGVWHGTMVVDGNLLYVLCTKWGPAGSGVLDVFDLTNPLSLTRLSSTPVAQVSETSCEDLAILQPYAIVLAGPSLVVVDVSDPSQPEPLGAYDPLPPELQGYDVGEYWQVKAWQDHVVIQNDVLGIEVLDVAEVLARLGRLSNLAYSPATGFSFLFSDATVGQPYRIQISPSLAEGSWADWMSFTYSGPIGLMDVGATGAEMRFYRAVSP